MNNGDMPASPTIYADMGHNGQREIFCDNTGLTKREAFAMAAMQAILSNPSLIDICSDDTVDFVRFNSVRIANSVLDELAKEQKNENN